MCTLLPLLSERLKSWHIGKVGRNFNLSDSKTVEGLGRRGVEDRRMMTSTIYIYIYINIFENSLYLSLHPALSHSLFLLS